MLKKNCKSFLQFFFIIKFENNIYFSVLICYNEKNLHKELDNLKKIIAILMAAAIIFTLCACSKTETNEEPTSDADAVMQQEEEKITGMIFGLVNAEPESMLSTEFSCNGGVITPERIAAGLSGWTGLKFRISVETDDTNKAITINWLPESSINETQVPDTDRVDFTFDSVEQMQIFMLNSLCYSVMTNLDGYDIYYTLNGEDISTLGLEGISSETAFNKTESNIVFVK